MKQFVLKLLKARFLQPMWERLHHLSLMGMNYWGGSDINNSGEIPAMKYIFSKQLAGKELIVFDVGANTGGYAKALNNNIPASLSCKVYSFEPSSIAFQKLEAAKSGLSKISLSIFNHGFSDKPEKIKLFTPYSGASIASVYSLRNPIREFKEEFSEMIELKTIDDFCEENIITAIDFLKIDVEGHELSILKGASKMIRGRKIKYIQFEFGDCNIESKSFMRDFYDTLSESYQLFRILPNGLWRMPVSYKVETEVFATVNFLAELR